LIQEFEEHDRFRDFIAIRHQFEEFLLKHRILVNQVTVKYGSAAKGFPRLKQFLLYLVDEFSAGKNEAQILEGMTKHDDFSYLQPAERLAKSKSRDFSSDAKSAVFLRDALKNPLRCGICNGLIHRNAISIDHVQRKADGGLGELDNGQLTHPYCNTTIKN
jgi:HNH endonuclease